jgi:hypothetical protein
VVRRAGRRAAAAGLCPLGRRPLSPVGHRHLSRCHVHLTLVRRSRQGIHGRSRSRRSRLDTDRRHVPAGCRA